MKRKYNQPVSTTVALCPESPLLGISDDDHKVDVNPGDTSEGGALSNKKGIWDNGMWGSGSTEK